MAAEESFRLEGKRIWVAGHRGMVGSAIVRRLEREPCEIVTVERGAVDLTRQAETEAWIAEAKPTAIFLAAARVGGILANDTYRADFLYDNLMIEANVLRAAHQAGVAKVLFLGSSCIYPRLAPQPIAEDALLTGPLEPTNEAYAIAKIAGLKLAEAYRAQHGRDFISAMPSNLYGPNDNFDLASSHVLAALLRKAHEAKERGEEILLVWGTGRPRREFLHVDDCADALVLLMRAYSGADHINVGAGEDLTVLELAKLVADVVGFEGKIVTDPSKPDGIPQKLLNSERMREMGWQPRIELREGLERTYRSFLEHVVDRQ